MDETEQRWLGAPERPDHVDLSEPHEPGGLGLGREATEWAQSLLEVARFELARADDKANTLFRFYGVVAALSIGLLGGSSASPTNLTVAAQVFFWTGCAAFLASGVYLGRTLYPRDIRGTPSERLLYFGHVIQYGSVDDLAVDLRDVETDSDRRLLEQLMAVSRLAVQDDVTPSVPLFALGAGRPVLGRIRTRSSPTSGADRPLEVASEFTTTRAVSCSIGGQNLVLLERTAVLAVGTGSA